MRVRLDSVMAGARAVIVRRSAVSLIAALAFLAIGFAGRPGRGAESLTVIGAADPGTYGASSGKVHVEAAEGRSGKAVRLRFDDACQSAFAAGHIHGAAEWDRADGVSFWMKGDGSDHLGGVELIWNEDYAVRYDYAFPIDNPGWRKVIAAWRDFVPVLPGANSKPLGVPTGNAPSNITGFWWGKWWYWADYAAHSFTIEDVRLEKSIPSDTRDYRPVGGPLSRVRAKIRAGKPITVVTMGDSLTDLRHWTNRTTNWPAFLKSKLKAQFGVGATVVNPALGGTQLRQNVILIPRWSKTAPAPDLVTICFGYNDWDAGMRGAQFLETQEDAIDRVRRATGGKADVLLITTCPAAGRWDEMAELADACRRAAANRRAGIADTYAALHEAGKTDRDRLYVQDHTHLSPAGQELFAGVVLKALSGE